MDDILLSVQNLATRFNLKKGILTAVDNISFKLNKGETFGLVGESGCGKSVTALSILQLNPSPPARSSGKILFDGEDLLSKSTSEMRAIRGKQISMIFQEPMTSLNPALTIEKQISETIMLHQKLGKRQAREKTVEMLNHVSIPSAKERLNSYPHEFSGGMRQRVMIAMALSCNPFLLIADEPTTALDVTIEAQFLDLLNELREKFNTSILYISHDLFVIGQICKNVGVMYASEIVELTGTNRLFQNPLHPYTQGLMKSIPNQREKKKYLESIKGVVCSLLNPPPGCKFHPRCPHAMEICRNKKPILKEVEKEHSVMCHLF